MFSKTVADNKNSFLEQTKVAREERAAALKKEADAILVQSIIRGWLARQRFTKEILNEFDNLIPSINENVQMNVMHPAVEVYHTAMRFFIIMKPKRDRNRFERLCKYIVQSLFNESPKISYIGVFLSKEYSIDWIRHIKKLLLHCCEYLAILKPESVTDMPSILVHLHTIMALTSTNTWAIAKTKSLEPLRNGMNQLCANIFGDLLQKGYLTILKRLLVGGLCREKVVIKAISMNAITTLSLRPLILANFSEKLLTTYIINIMSVPALVWHMQQLSQEAMTSFRTNKVLEKCLQLLSTEQNLKIVFNALEGNLALCLLANLIHLVYIENEIIPFDAYYPTFVLVTTRLLESCQQYVTCKKGNLTNWHPVLGWFCQSMEPQLASAMPNLKIQLSYLWSTTMIKKLLQDPLNEILANTSEEILDPGSSLSPYAFSSNPAAFIKRAIEARTTRANQNKNWRKLGSPECTKVALVCTMYQTSLATLTQIKMDILTGLCNQEDTLYSFWRFLCTLGPNCGLKSFLDLLVDCKQTAPELQMLALFADCMTNYITILDDVEMYEQQDPFKLTDFVKMSTFLNLFIYKSIVGQLFDLSTLHSNALFNSMHTLLLVLYRRDSRRRYTPDDHWLVKEMREGQFIADLDKGKKPQQILIQHTPHMLAHEERVRLFRRAVSEEKAALGLTDGRATLVSVHRQRIVEDGYRQLAALPPRALKGTIRVRFLNHHGLDEAGIDQDGVFKEFLEETIKRVFDPSLNLFCVTSDERLYPSPSSQVQDNHLQLFEFVGRMLGKALYEGIVVDVPFASFFLSQVLGQTNMVLYSWIDELPSLDKELYRSLTYLKHYEGDISTLELTFSNDEERLGEIVTHELLPGGKGIAVTNENKINYIHLMAHFRMHTQIRDQTNAFIKGFRSIINPDWLSLFSIPEFQRLISGDNVPLDLRDLRRHTQYYGGFHDSHRVVCWLWDVLQRDFSEEERAMFLKFVTSCSKPPVLGFAHLKPPFSIRCVEVGDDEDTGDTIGSVIRGFFTIRKKDPLNRLPTSSTCFNLLKLPNYQKRSTLRDKLRYAINSNTGFELS